MVILETYKSSKPQTSHLGLDIASPALLHTLAQLAGTMVRIVPAFVHFALL